MKLEITKEPILHFMCEAFTPEQVKEIRNKSNNNFEENPVDLVITANGVEVDPEMFIKRFYEVLDREVNKRARELITEKANDIARRLDILSDEVDKACIDIFISTEFDKRGE